MASVHPSRAGLVPRGRTPPRDSRDNRDDRGRDNDRGRRQSPEYREYRRPSPQRVENQAPANMYASRGGQGQAQGGYSGGGGGGGGGADFMEGRRIGRENMSFSIWPQSPKAAHRGPSPSRKSRKKGKRARSPSSSSDSSDDSSACRRREKKEKKRSKKYKDGRSSRRKQSRSRSPRRRSRSRTPKESAKPTRPVHAEDDEDQWVEKSNTMPPPAIIPVKPRTKEDGAESESDDEHGPQPAYKVLASKGGRIDERAFGGALLRGEGSAMAAFLAEDPDARIPRRGEIGLTPDEIAQYEDVGYVMSGSRHRRMNAVRMRKENQVISAEEKRGILKLQKEERERRETILREEFSELVQERLNAQEGKKKA